MKGRFILLACLAGAFCFAVPSATQAQVERAGAYYNPYTGASATAKEGYNPYTGTAAKSASSYNPYTGRDSSTKEVTNPYTGSSAEVRQTTNAYTGRSTYSYAYRRR